MLAHMGSARSTIRKIVGTFAGALLLAAFVGPLSEFLIEIARERGWYDSPSARVVSALQAFAAFAEQPWFLTIVAFFVGLTVGLWADSLLRRREESKVVSGHAKDLTGESTPSGQVIHPTGAVPRDFLSQGVTPERLSLFFQNTTELQGGELVRPFIGKWMRLSGKIEAVAPLIAGNSVMVTLEEQSGITVRMVFDNRDRVMLHHLVSGDKILAEGRLTKVDRWGVVLEDCEFVSSK